MRRMAKRVVTHTTYTDDLDGSNAATTISFGYDGANYEIDLSKANAKAFNKAMARYVGHARKVRDTRSRATTRRNAATAAHDLAAIREWAKSNGYAVSQRGRIAGAVLDAYTQAH